VNERGFGMDVGKSEVNGEFGEFIGDDNFIVSEKIS
jgi:hypothetical protein